MTSTPPRPPSPTEWLNRFLAAYCRRRPVNATFIGIHDHDALLPDFSDRGLADLVIEMASLLSDGATIDLEKTTPIERLDLRVAFGFLTTQLWEFGSNHGPRGNPSLAVSEAVFGAMSLLLSDFAPYPARLASLEARLSAVPRLLAQARDQIRTAPLPWIERALRECRGTLAFLEQGIATLEGRPATLDRAAAAAAAAVSDYRDYLLGQLAPRASSRAAAGEEALTLLLREAHFTDQSPAEIARFTEEELSKAEAELAAAGRTMPAASGASLDYQREWEAARARAVAADLITWPDFPIRYRPRPSWAAAAAPDLYFLHYRAPAAFGHPEPHEYLVPDDHPGDSAVRLNHVIHHGGIGHHLQNWYAYRSASRIGRIAAVDCASRTAMLAGGTMAEGWACYATDLMAEIGYLTPEERLDEIATRRRICARAIVDVELHSGRFGFERAARFYRERAGMTGEQAAAEVTKNSMFPGGAVIYLLGLEGIHQLRRQLAQRGGNGFSLKAFHDRLLSFGSLPVPLIAQEMLRETEAATR